MNNENSLTVNNQFEDQVVDKIVGVQFLQSNLEYLRTLILKNDNKLGITASSLTAYICLHYISDAQGYINKEDFSYTQTAKEYNLPYSSFYKGVQKLYEFGLIVDELIEKENYIRIVGFVEEQQKLNKYNYFILPSNFLKSKLPNALIKARDTNGMIGVLDLLNQMYREHSIKHSKNSLNTKVTIVRRYKNWMEKIKKTNRNISDFVLNLANYFEIQEVNQEEKRKRNKKVEVQFKKETYEEVKELQRIIYRATYDEVESHLRQTKFKQQKNMKRIASVVIEDLSKPLYYLSGLLDIKKIKKYIYYVFQKSLEDIGEISQKDTIRNFIGLLRSLIKNNIYLIPHDLAKDGLLIPVKNELLNNQSFPKHFVLPFFDTKLVELNSENI